ncbi:MAG: hypothetical protein N2448_01300 [Caloramator sp.]|nr:hypothetical protein [Caloramator sp.]
MFKKIGALVLTLLLLIGSFGNFKVNAATKAKVVTFKDKNLENEIRLELNKMSGSITVNDMQKLKYLSECYNVKDLTGLEYATNLEILIVEEAKFTTIKQLKGLKKLSTLFISSSNKLVINDLDTILPTLNKLTTIELKNVPVKSTTLAKLPYIERYRLENNGLTDINFVKNNKSKIDIQFITIGNQIADFSPLKGKNLDLLTILNDAKLNSKTLQGVDKVENTFPRINTIYLGGKENKVNIDVDYLPSADMIYIYNVNNVKPINKYYTDTLQIEGANQVDLKSIIENYQEKKESDFHVKSISLTADNITNYDDIGKITGKPLFIDMTANTMEQYNKLMNLVSVINKNNSNIGFEVKFYSEKEKIAYNLVNKDVYLKLIENVKRNQYSSLDIKDLLCYKVFNNYDISHRYHEDTGILELDYGLNEVFGNELSDGFKIYDKDFNEVVNKGLDYTLDNNIKELLQRQQVNDVAFKGVTLMVTPDFKYMIGACVTDKMKLSYFVIDMNKATK